MSSSYKILNIPFDNPFLLSSAPPTAEISSIDKAFSLGWGGAVLKTITPDNMDIRDVRPRFATLKNNGKNIGFENIELLSRHNLEYWIDGIQTLNKKHPSKVIIASIMAPVKKEDWQNLILQLQETPIDAFELNFSCPHGMPEKGVGMAIGTNSEISTMITRWAKEVSKVPVFVKLSPNVTNIAQIASDVAQAGADGLTAINTVQSLVGVDLDTLTPLPNVDGYSTFGGYSGKAVKPIALRCIAQMRSVTDIPILACGGISSWEDAAEFIALGADGLQVCTEVMLNGYSIINNMTKGLDQYLQNKQLTLKNLKGQALKKIQAHSSLSENKNLCANIDIEKCIQCGKCITICQESAFNAISIVNGCVQVDSNRCDGCSLCSHVCPMHAITMKQK